MSSIKEPWAEILRFYLQWKSEESNFFSCYHTYGSTFMVPSVSRVNDIPPYAQGQRVMDCHAAQTDWNKLNRVSSAIKCHSSDPISWHRPTCCRHLGPGCPFVSIWAQCKYYTWKHLQVQSSFFKRLRKSHVNWIPVRAWALLLRLTLWYFRCFPINYMLCFKTLNSL